MTDTVLDLKSRRDLMVKLRDDAAMRGPQLRPLAKFYAKECIRLSMERIREIVRGKRLAK